MKFYTITSGVRIDGNANVSSNVIVGNNIVFEGHTDDGNQTTLHAIHPTGNQSNSFTRFKWNFSTNNRYCGWN